MAAGFEVGPVLRGNVLMLLVTMHKVGRLLEWSGSRVVLDGWMGDGTYWWRTSRVRWLPACASQMVMERKMMSTLPEAVMSWSLLRLRWRLRRFLKGNRDMSGCG